MLTGRIEDSAQKSKPRPFPPHKLYTWPSRGTVLTRGTEGSMLEFKATPLF